MAQARKGGGQPRPDGHDDQIDRRVVSAAAVLLVLGLFLFSVRPVLSPIVLFLLLVLLLGPYAGSRLHRSVLLLASLLTLLWLLTALGTLLAPFVLALFLAYLLDPLVDRLEELNVSRSLAILLLAFPAVVLLLVALLYGVPAVVDQLESLSRTAPALLAQWTAGLERLLLRLDLPGLGGAELVEWLRGLDAERIGRFLQERQGELARNAWAAVLGLGRGLGTVIMVLGYLVLTPVLTFYLLRDYDNLTGRVRPLLPESSRERWLAFGAEYDRLLSRYLRGQLLVAAAVGVATWLLLWVLRFPYSGLVGSVAGVFNVVPYLGLLVSLVPALLIAFLSGSLFLSLLKLAIAFAVVQVLDSAVLGPRIVGGSVGLHPVWVMLALAVGGFFFGFVGLLIAVPAAALLKLLLRYGVDRYRTSPLFQGGPGADGAPPG